MSSFLKRLTAQKIIILQTLTFISIVSVTVVQAREVTTKSFIEQLKQHYKKTNMLNTYTVTLKSSGKSASQSYDYNNPDTTYRRDIVDIDLGQMQYFSHLTRAGFPGGFVFDTVDFQKEMKRYRYDVNGVLHGKRVLELDTKFGFQYKVDEVNEAVDVLAVQGLLSDLTEKTILKSNINTVLNQITIEKDSMRLGKLSYIFQLKPIKLLSHYNERNGQRFTYSDPTYYQGITYASKVLMEEENYQREMLVENLAVTGKIDPMKLSIPMGYGPIVKNEQPALLTEMIAKDIYLISNVSDRYVAFKVDKTGIMVFGAPLSERMSEQVIAHINKQFPNKEINSVYISHPHSDHIGGLVAYAKKGVTILADAYSVEAIKAFPRFAKDIAMFKFSAFKHKEVINGVRFYIPKNAHAKGQSFAYFQESEIIYEGDLLEIPFDNSIATYISEVEKQFVEFVRAEKLSIKRIIGHHRNGNISLDVMNAYYDANTQL